MAEEVIIDSGLLRKRFPLHCGAGGVLMKLCYRMLQNIVKALQKCACPLHTCSCLALCCVWIYYDGTRVVGGKEVAAAVVPRLSCLPEHYLFANRDCFGGGLLFTFAPIPHSCPGRSIYTLYIE